MEKYYKQFLGNNSKLEISSDFSLIFKLLFQLIIYLISLPFYLLGTLFYLLFDLEKSGEYFSKIISKPFNLLKDILDWFFEAKYSAFLIIFLIIIFILEFLFLVPNYIGNFMFSPIHFFEGNFYSIFTSIFLHADIFHLLGNLLGILIFGRVVEKQFHSKVLLLFISSAFIANLISGFIYYLLADFTPSLGASGGIAGLIIFAILLEPLSFTTVFLFPLPIFLVGYFLISLDIINLFKQSAVNHLAHIGGYLALVILFFFLELHNKKKLLLGLSINLLMILLIYLVIKIIGVEKIINLI